MSIFKGRLLRRGLAGLILGLGLLLVGLAVAYYAYALISESQLDRLAKTAGTREGEVGSALSSSPKVPESPLSQIREATPTFVPSDDSPALRIVISKIGVDSSIVELETEYKDGELVWQTAKNAVGHHRGSANPGATGNVILSGHMSSPLSGEGAVFKRLPELGLGDEVTLFTATARYLYRVIEVKVVLPEQVEVMKQTATPMVTLITCVPDWVYTHRLIVTAKLEKASPLA